MSLYVEFEFILLNYSTKTNDFYKIIRINENMSTLYNYFRSKYNEMKLIPPKEALLPC